jgi:DNA-binding transcriptional regulator YhcF (GntR family)
MGTVQVVAATIKQGILTGRFRRGSRLPSARVLSGQLRVNKNTANKAYGLLAREGRISVAAGRRAVVARATAARRAASTDFLRGELGRVLLPILREAALLGVPTDRLLAIASDEIRSFHDGAGRRLYLVECNRMEAQQYAQDLSGMLGVAVEGRLIDELPRLAIAGSDVVVVPYYLDEVVDCLGCEQTVGIQVAPEPETLFRLIEAAQAPDGKAALICGNPRAAKRFGKLFEFYTTKPIRITNVQDLRAVKALVAASSVVFATPAAVPAVARLSRTKPVPFTERIDPEPLQPLRQLLSGIGARSKGRGRPTLARRDVARCQVGRVDGSIQDGVDMMRGWGDVEFVATDHRVPTIYFGPGTVAAAHTADEYIDLDRYHTGVAVYERAIPEFLGAS